MSYSLYIESQTNKIKSTLSDVACQPVIFIGAGLSKRYIGGLSWFELLDSVSKKISKENRGISFLYQKYQKNLLAVADELVPICHEWAWSEAKSEFEENLFNLDTHKSYFIKYYISKFIKSNNFSIYSEYLEEVSLLKNIVPHCVITTNYDELCESIFSEHECIVGQKIIKSSFLSIGEIFKIHGCVNDYSEIILTTEDYDVWSKKKKYISAKLLAYFLEHPVLIVGYSLQDPNVLSILQDIDEILSCDDQVVSNIYYVIYDKNITENSNPASEAILDLGNGKTMRVNALYANDDYKWIYDAFQSNSIIENVSPKILRSLMSRTYDLVRHDIPKSTVQVSFSTLEQVVNNGDELPKLLGISCLTNPSQVNAEFPYLATDVAKKLGYNTWHIVDKLIKKIISEKGINIQDSDNIYHIKLKTGVKSSAKKYSEACVDLLKKVINNDDYDLKID